jgi:hypothetical protein
MGGHKTGSRNEPGRFNCVELSAFAMHRNYTIGADLGVCLFPRTGIVGVALVATLFHQGRPQEAPRCGAVSIDDTSNRSLPRSSLGEWFTLMGSSICCKEESSFEGDPRLRLEDYAIRTSIGISAEVASMSQIEKPTTQGG